VITAAGVVYHKIKNPELKGFVEKYCKVGCARSFKFAEHLFARTLFGDENNRNFHLLSLNLLYPYRL